MGKLDLNYKLLKPFINARSNQDTENYLMIEIKPSSEIVNNESALVKGIDFCIVLDVSGSMNARFGDSISKLDAAVRAAEKLYEFLGEQDTVSLILYDSKPYVILNRAQNISKAQLQDALWKAYKYGGSTNISEALRKAREILRGESDNIKRIIFLTDGNPTVDTEEDGLKEGQYIAEEGIGMTVLGIGDDFNYKFLEELVKPSRGTTDWLKSPDDAIMIFQKAFRSAKSTVITNVELTLKFSSEVRVTEFYRALPETTYYGKLELDAQRTAKIKIDDIQNNKIYQYIFQVTVLPPKTPYEGMFRIATVKMEYRIPALGNDKYTESAEVIAEYTYDYEKFTSEYQSVREVVSRCYINKLDTKLNEALKKNDKVAIVSIIDELIDRTKELGETELESHYTEMKKDYAEKGIIPNELLIKASNSSTKVNGEGTLDVDPKEVFGF